MQELWEGSQRPPEKLALDLKSTTLERYKEFKKLKEKKKIEFSPNLFQLVKQ